MGDADGWKRGAGPYSRSYPKMDRPEDYMFRSSARKLNVKNMDGGGADNLDGYFDGFSSALPKGGEPRYAPKGAGPAFNPGKRAVPKPSGKLKSRDI